MAYLAIRGNGRINGESQLDGKVSREIFQPLFPQDEVPVGSVTNGIHVPTWDSLEADSLWTTACCKERWRGPRPAEDDIRQLTDDQIWQMRTAVCGLISYIRERYVRQLASEGRDPSMANGIPLV